MESVHDEPGSDLVALTSAALAGDRVAWEQLVDCLTGAVWGAIRRFDLPVEDRKDAFAMTFLRLYERLGSVREPARLHGWVATTARNEVLAILRSRRRLVPVEIVDAHLPPVLDSAVESILDGELQTAMSTAFLRLSDSCQRLLRLVTADPPIPYAEIGRTLEMKIGSIGPTRQRCLARLREMPELRPYCREVAL